MATPEDAARVYADEMLSVRGQVDLEHYETRLRLVLGTTDYRTALELLTEAAIEDGLLSDAAVDRYRERTDIGERGVVDPPSAIDDVLRLLEHDGYLERRDGGYRFVYGLLEDWWRARHGRHFVPVARRT